MAPKVIDIEEIVVAWAWNTFLRTRSKDYKNLQYDDVKIEINWERTKFTGGKPEYKDEQMQELPKVQVVFTSVYENKTKGEQEHTFQTERTTVSCCSTNITKGYTKGMHVELKLGLPDEVAGATVGFGREVNMERSEENTEEVSVTWSINSNIKVPGNHKTIAKLVVKEQEYRASFKMATRIRGRVVAIVTNLRDHNAFVQSIESDFVDIMRGLADKYSKYFTIEGNTIIWEVEGSCQFRFGVEQHVELTEVPLMS